MKRTTKTIMAFLTAMTMTTGAMSVTAYAEEAPTMVETAEEQFTVDNVDNPAYTAYVKAMQIIPHEKELIELIDSNIKHIYSEPKLLVEFEEEDGTRIFKDCSSIWFDWVIDDSGVRNGHTVEEANEYLKEIGSKQYYKYVTHPNGESVYSLYNWGTDNGMDGDSEDVIMGVWIKLCQKFDFEVGWNASMYGSERFPKFKQGEEYGTYITLDPARYGTEEGKVEVKLYEDGRTEYPSGAIKYADETIKYPEGYEPPTDPEVLMTFPPTPATDVRELSEVTSALKGDANLDGRVDLADLTTVAKYNLSNEAYPLENETAYANADMNSDGVVDGLDTSALIEDQLGKK